MSSGAARIKISEVLPKNGLVYSERGPLPEILCKPKILPLKSAVLEQLEAIEKAADVEQEAEAKQEVFAEGSAGGGGGGGTSERVSFEQQEEDYDEGASASASEGKNHK